MNAAAIARSRTLFSARARVPNPNPLRSAVNSREIVRKGLNEDLGRPPSYPRLHAATGFVTDFCETIQRLSRPVTELPGSAFACVNARMRARCVSYLSVTRNRMVLND